MMEIREAATADLPQILQLYTQLHDNNLPVIDNKLTALWQRILLDKDHHILLGFVDGQIISSCVLVIIPNLTYKQRPYGLIENVITHEAYRGKGYASALLDYARNIAMKENCYKIMLLTGAKEESTLSFYEKAGYNRRDKTAFIQWLDKV